jgi:hypothetical protein
VHDRTTDAAAAVSAETGGFAVAVPTEVLVHERDLVVARKLLRER